MGHFVIEVEVWTDETEEGSTGNEAGELRYVIETAVENFADLDGVTRVYVPPTRVLP